MGPSARVTSIDAVRAFTAALRCFGEEASGALTDLELEVTRAVEWIQHDRKGYWTQQVRRGWDGVAEARSNLERAMTFRRVADHRPACREEKMLLEKMKRRLRVAQEKVEAVRRWSYAVDRAVTECRSSVSQFARWLEVDLPQALAALEGISSALESYVGLKSSARAGAAGGGSSLAEGDGEDASGRAPSPQPQQSLGNTHDRPAPDGVEDGPAREP